VLHRKAKIKAINQSSFFLMGYLKENPTSFSKMGSLGFAHGFPTVKGGYL
jgi:hypothetical protein